MNYAPLRTSITQQPGCAVNFTVDRPRAQFGSLSDLRIAQTGLELDHKLAALIAHLGGNSPAELQDTRSHRANRSSRLTMRTKSPPR